MTGNLTRRILVYLFGCMLLFVSFPLFSAGEDESVPVINDPTKDWLLYIGPMQIESVDEDLKKVAEQFKIALNDSLKHLDYHHYHVDEKKGYEKYLYDKALQQFRRDLSKKYREWDSLEINGEAGKLEKLDAEIDLLQRNIEKSSHPVLPDKKAISVQEEKNRKTFLSILERKKGDAFLDLLIRPSANAFMVTGKLYLPFISDDPQLVRVRFKPEQIETAASDFLSQMKSRFLGRPWASITLPREPLAVALFEDGARLSAEDRLRLFPGQHSFIVSAPGFYPERVDLFLLPGENRMIDVTLREKPSVSALVQSFDPERINIYLDGAYVGETPVWVETNTLPVLVRGEQEDYIGQEWIISRKNGESQAFFFHLQPDIYDREKLLQNNRKRFYNRFGLFLLSLPITMVSYGNSVAYAAAANTSWSEELTRLNSLWYTAYLGGLFLNVILGSDMIIQLVNYIERYERFHGIERR